MSEPTPDVSRTPEMGTSPETGRLPTEPTPETTAEEELRRARCTELLEQDRIASAEKAADLSADLKKGEEGEAQLSKKDKAKKMMAQAGSSATEGAGFVAKKGVRYGSFGLSAIFTSIESWGQKLLKQGKLDQIPLIGPLLGKWLLANPEKSLRERTLAQEKKDAEAEKKKAEAAKKKAASDKKQLAQLQKAGLSEDQAKVVAGALETEEKDEKKDEKKAEAPKPPAPEKAA